MCPSFELTEDSTLILLIICKKLCVHFSNYVALTQAGQHMEDSIISSYSALLLAVLAKHNSVRY